MALFVGRHAERADQADKKWILTSSRPFDPPLTAKGLQQAEALAARLVQDQGLVAPRARITHIYASPFTRTVETAAACAKALGIGSIKVEHGITEAMDGHWYKCFDSSPWAKNILAGGGRLPNGEDLLVPTAYLHDNVSSLVDIKYKSAHRHRGISREEPESAAVRRARLRAAYGRIYRRHIARGESVLVVVHGAVVEDSFILLAAAAPPPKKIHYTSLSLFRAPPEAAGWARWAVGAVVAPLAPLVRWAAGGSGLPEGEWECVISSSSHHCGLG